MRRQHTPGNDDETDTELKLRTKGDNYFDEVIASNQSERSRKIERTLARNLRHILPVRQIGGSSIISLPKAIRKPMDLQIGDRIMIEYDPLTSSLKITKDSEGNRQRGLKDIDNLNEISKLCAHLKRSDELGDAVWCRRLEKVLLAIVKHLKGDILERAEDDDGEDL